MKSSIIYLSFILNIGLAVGLIYSIYRRAWPVVIGAEPKASKTVTYGQKIAIFEPVAHPAIEDIERGFRDTLSKSMGGEYTFKVYNAQGNKTLMRAQAEEILQGSYDLIFSIGAAPTQLIAELRTKKNIAIPIIFAAVDDPVGIGIANSLELPGKNITGVREEKNFEEQLSFLLMLKPSVKRMLLVYDPTQGTGLEKYKKQLQDLIAQKGISFQAIEIYQAHEIQQKVTGFLEGTDVVLVLKDNTVVSGIDSLINLCNRFNVTLYASDLNSGDKGAVLAYGIREYDTGVEGAEKARLVLEEYKAAGDIPITPVKQYKLQINSRTLKMQGLGSLSQSLLRLIQIGTVI